LSDGIAIDVVTVFYGVFIEVVETDIVFFGVGLFDNLVILYSSCRLRSGVLKLTSNTEPWTLGPYFSSSLESFARVLSCWTSKQIR